MWIGLLPSLSWLLLAADPVSVVPLMSVVPLPGPERALDMVVRNVSPRELHGLRLAVEAEDALAAFEVSPDPLDVCRPSDRCLFTIRVQRTPATGSRRFSFAVRVLEGERELRALRLMVDARPEAGEATGEGWIDVGVVQVGDEAGGWRRVSLTLLVLAPLLLLAWWGARLKRRERGGPPRKRSAAP